MPEPGQAALEQEPVPEKEESLQKTTEASLQGEEAAGTKKAKKQPDKKGKTKKKKKKSKKKK